MSDPFLFETRVRFVDTDASGRIHYTAMFRYFEAAEQEFLRSRGLGYAQLQDGDYGFPRVHVDCDFSGAMSYDDLLQISVKVAHVGRSSFTFAFEALRDGRAMAAGKVTIVCMSRIAQKAQPLPPALERVLREAAAV